VSRLIEFPPPELRWWFAKIYRDRNGWRFHSDGIHLNLRSGLIVADRVQN
jgi:hypothetical protein